MKKAALQQRILSKSESQSPLPPKPPPPMVHMFGLTRRDSSLRKRERLEEMKRSKQLGDADAADGAEVSGTHRDDVDTGELDVQLALQSMEQEEDQAAKHTLQSLPPDTAPSADDTL